MKYTLIIKVSSFIPDIQGIEKEFVSYERLARFTEQFCNQDELLYWLYKKDCSSYVRMGAIKVNVIDEKDNIMMVPYKKVISKNKVLCPIKKNSKRGWSE